jgi:hypothetical protein
MLGLDPDELGIVLLLDSGDGLTVLGRELTA